MVLRFVIASLAFLATCVFAQANSVHAIIKLLNSRSSGSPKGYADAAEIVAQDAENGQVLQRFVIAVVALQSDAPPAARKLSDSVRTKYLAETRDKIRDLAERKGNGLAWYLLSLEENNKDFLKRAASAGNVQALNAWGTQLIMGAFTSDLVPSNKVEEILVEGFNCFKKAASKADANGAYNLGVCYMNGYGCKKDQDLAFNCFRTAAEMGHPEAFNNIGGCYRDGRVVRKNLELATKFFEKSANMGNAYGQYNYALALQRGEGIGKDEKRAFEFFTKASDNGSAEAMNSLAMCYFNGTGTNQDLYKAVQLYRKSASLGLAIAMDNLATCYDLGKGVTKSKEKAVEWRVRASAARGDRNARAWLEKNGYPAL